MRIGVLALQGSVIEHKKILEKLPEIEAVEVKTAADLESISGIILPGGESTTIGKLLRDFHLLAPLKKRIESGMPVWGTCAGLILLAKNIVGEAPHLGVMDITVQRNAYGRQLDSFITETIIKEVSSKSIPLVFVRAPWIESVGENVSVLLRLNGHIVAARDQNMLATSFHPELTESTDFHAYFATMCRQYAKEN